MMKIGIDIGGTNIKIGLLDESGKLQKRRSVRFPRGKGSSTVFSAIKETAFGLLEETGTDFSKVDKVGAAVPGSIDAAGERVIEAHNLGFYDVPIKEELKNAFPEKAVQVMNDGDAAAKAELYCGTLKGVETGIFLSVGTGLGGALILNGRLFSGGRGRGTEPGHMLIDAGGLQCSCGNFGCAETVCSATWLVRRGRQSLRKNPDSMIAHKCGGAEENLSAKMVIDSAKAGDSAALQIWNEFLDSFSNVIASLVNLLDPQVVVIGGGVSLAGEILFLPLRIKTEEKTFRKDLCPILPAVMGNDAGMIGAAL